MVNSLPIRKFATVCPVVIKPRMHLKTAKYKMAEHGIRHLPVVAGKKIVGVISDRDIKLAESVYADRDPDRDVRVQDLCLFDPYTVDGNTPLSTVAEELYKRKIGSCLITKDGELAGIFTTTDACRIIVELCKKEPSQESFFDSLLSIIGQ